jgi:hypothetical protein
MIGHQITDAQAAREFILAGDAIFTLVSKATGTRFTYRITKPEERRGSISHFVRVLTSSDNVDGYQYIGQINADNDPRHYYHGRKSRIGGDTPSVRAIRWFLSQLWYDTGRQALTSAEMWHEGRCGRCARRLTVPSSIERGIGPDCAALMCEAV